MRFICIARFYITGIVQSELFIWSAVIVPEIALIVIDVVGAFRVPLINVVHGIRMQVSCWIAADEIHIVVIVVA